MAVDIRRSRPLDRVDLASNDSFPASDPPSAMPGTSPAQPSRPVDLDEPDPELVEVVEHPISNPSVRVD